MTLLTLPGEGLAFPYAGQPMHILAGHDGQPPGFAAMEITVPPHFAGPIPHAHDGFDEAIYVLSGRLLVLGDAEPQEAPPGSMFVAPRGHRHGFSNPSGEMARVLGLWAPAEPALAFMRDIGAALTPDTPPDPDRMREIYARHASRLLPLPRQLLRAHIPAATRQRHLRGRIVNSRHRRRSINTAARTVRRTMAGDAT